MQILAKEITKRLKNETQKLNVYKLDRYLERVMEEESVNLDKLYGNLSKDSSIIELTNKLFNDFNVEDVSSASINPKGYVGYSYQQGYRIIYDEGVFESNCIETVLHEFAHYIVDNLFSLRDKHGAFFTTVLKWLFNHYEIMDELHFEVGNKVVANGKIKFLDEALIEIRALSNVEVEYLLENKDMIRKTKSGTSVKYELINKDKKEKHVLRHNEKTGKGVLTIRKLFGYELEELMIENISKEELLGFTIISPIYVMDDEGYQVTARCHWAGMEGFEISEVVKEGEKYKLKKSICRKYDKEELKRNIKQVVSKAKQNKLKYKRCYTISEYYILRMKYSDLVYLEK